MTSINGFRVVRSKITLPATATDPEREAALELHVSIPHSIDAVRLNRLMDARDTAFDLVDVTQQRLEAARARLRERDDDEAAGKPRRRRRGNATALSGADLLTIMDEVDALTKAAERAEARFKDTEADMLRAASGFINNITIEQADGSMDDLDFEVANGAGRKPWPQLSQHEKAAACSMLRGVILQPLFMAMVAGADVSLAGK